MLVGRWTIWNTLFHKVATESIGCRCCWLRIAFNKHFLLALLSVIKISSLASSDVSGSGVDMITSDNWLMDGDPELD